MNQIHGFCFEFKKHNIIPSGYEIRSYSGDNASHLKSWVFEGSNDNESWTKLDERRSNFDLNGPNNVQSFVVNNEKQLEFKYLRIRITDVSWNSDYYLLMNSFEIYGKIL